MREIWLFLVFLPGIFALPEQGAFEVNMTKQKNIAVFTKSMFKNTSITVKIKCIQDRNVLVKITWLLRWTPCAREYANIDFLESLAAQYINQPDIIMPGMLYNMVKYKKKTQNQQACYAGGFITLDPDLVSNNNAKSRRRRQADKDDPKADPNVSPPTTTLLPMSSSTQLMAPEHSNADAIDKFHQLTSTWEDGIYLFIIQIEGSSEFEASVDVRMRGPQGGFLSAMEWPLLPFYGVMCFVYVIFSLLWLVLSFCNRRELLGIQFLIGGVIFLGMLEKAVFFAEYEYINTSGRSVRGAILFGELVSCLKRTLAKILVIIISVGFGIVKPRSGLVLYTVLALGGMYFIVSAVEGCRRDLKHKADPTNQATLSAVSLVVIDAAICISLVVIDAAICGLIIKGLVKTFRTLRLRRNLVKLSLYRYFTITLIFAVVATVAFIVWSVTQHYLSKCLSGRKTLWVDDAFWHLLSSVILLVIMILWRPSANNQRYVFSPLMDAADDETGEPVINDAFVPEDGMKMKSMIGQTNSSPRHKSKDDEDLKWMDENIPTPVANM